jgi:hypothetical protein
MPGDTALSTPAEIATTTPPKINGFAAGAPVMPVVPRSLAEVAMVAAAMIKAGLVPDGYEASGASDDERYDKTKARLMIGIMKGAEAGLPPIAALSAIAMIDHRPTIWGDGAMALVQRSGVVVKIESGFEGAPEGESAVADQRVGRHPKPRLSDFPQTMTAVYRIWRKGQEIPYEGRFSVQDAIRAHLWGNPKRRPWIEYPKRMLMARARAYALRDGFADCLMGLAFREELEDLPAAAPARTDTSFLDDGPAASAQPEPPVSPATGGTDISSEPQDETAASSANGNARGTAVAPEPASRSPLWEAPSYALMVPKNARHHADWRRLYDDLLSLIGEAASESELERLQHDNARAIEEIGQRVPHGREVLNQAFASRRKAIRGE